tara:strand:+ start:163 stop:372 length:210 start_codon:yes stop_codon:yes gene_type:complete
MKKEFEVVIKIPSYTLKTIYVDDATSKTDARKKAKKEMLGSTNYYDMSGDEDLGQCWEKATIISVEGGK